MRTQKERRRATWRKWFAKNRERERERSKKYYAQHRDEVIARHNKWVKDNRERARAYARTWYKNNGEERRPTRRRQYYQRVYGVDIDAMLAEQGGCCFICGGNNPGPKNWAVDHCHDKKKVRRVLCFRCNVVLGHVKDDAVLLRKMASYLEEQS
jgi:hypothetical protein